MDSAKGSHTWPTCSAAQHPIIEDVTESLNEGFGIQIIYLEARTSLKDFTQHASQRSPFQAFQEATKPVKILFSQRVVDTWNDL